MGRMKGKKIIMVIFKHCAKNIEFFASPAAMKTILTATKHATEILLPPLCARQETNHYCKGFPI